MEDFERIQHREHQRQELLIELKRVITNELDKEGVLDDRHSRDLFYWGLITGTTTYFSSLLVLGQRKLKGESYSIALDLLKDSLIPKIEAFTPVRAEMDLLAVELLKYAIEEISRPVHHKMTALSVPPGRDQYLKDTGLDKLED